MAILICAVCMMTGCETVDTSPGAGRGDPYGAPFNDPTITVIPPELREWLGFQSAIITEHEGRPMEVQVPMRNLTETPYILQYRILFYDAQGLELSPPMDWKRFALRSKQVVRLKATSLHTEAESYRLEVKWAE